VPLNVNVFLIMHPNAMQKKRTQFEHGF